MRTAIEMAREVKATAYTNRHYPDRTTYTFGPEQLKAFEALVRSDERERICKAIEEEDYYCVTEGDYMLDSDDCIAVTKGVWVRPEFNLGPIRARGNK